MIRTQIYLTPVLHQYFRRKALQNQTSMAREIRASLEDSLPQKKETKKKKITSQGPGKWFLKVAEQAEKMKYSGPKDLASKMDDYLYGDK